MEIPDTDTLIGPERPETPRVPETLPVELPPALVQPVWVPWPVAILLVPIFWLMPKKLGPHIAAAGWRAAMAVFVCWTLYGDLCSIDDRGLAVYDSNRGGDYYAYTLMAYLTGYTPQAQWLTDRPATTLLEVLRVPLVAAGMVIRASRPVEILLAPIVVAVGWILLAAGLMPYLTIGERARVLFGRSLRLLLWSTTSVFVLAMVVQFLAIMWFLPPFRYDYHGPWASDARVLQYFCSYWQVDLGPSVCALWALWALWLMQRASVRYSGPAEGPAWESRPVYCARCGYILLGLRADGICPECRLLIAKSLPEYRHPTAFAAAGSALRRLVAFPGTWAAALVQPRFFSRVRVHGDYAAARRFAIWTSFLTAAVLVVLTLWTDLRGKFALLYMILGSTPNVWVVPAAVVWLSIGMRVFVGLVALVCSGFGYRPIRQYATIVFYWSAWMPIFAAGLWAALVANESANRGNAMGVITNVWHVPPRVSDAVEAAVYFVTLLVVAAMALRLKGALQQGRFANA